MSTSSKSIYPSDKGLFFCELIFTRICSDLRFTCHLEPAFDFSFSNPLDSETILLLLKEKNDVFTTNLVEEPRHALLFSYKIEGGGAYLSQTEAVVYWATVL